MNLGCEYTESEPIVQSSEAAIERARDLVAELGAVTQHESTLLPGGDSAEEPPLLKSVPLP